MLIARLEEKTNGVNVKQIKSNFIAEQLAEFVYSLRRDPDRIPISVKTDATHRLLDNFGCISLDVRLSPRKKLPILLPVWVMVIAISSEARNGQGLVLQR
jgi:hypothetical protein